MNKTNTIILVCIIYLMSISCASTSKSKIEVVDKIPNSQQSSQENKIAPNTCRIVGTVMEIEQDLDQQKSDSPCAKFPCIATVRIDSVLGYGSGFLNPLSKGNTISVHFKYTTAPTKELFPQMATSYPGVKKGSTIKTDITERIAPRLNQKTSYVKYDISGYRVQ